MARCHEGGVEIGHELVPADASKDEPKSKGVVLESSRARRISDFRHLNPYLVYIFWSQHVMLNSRLRVGFERLESAIVSLSPVNASTIRW